MTALVRVLMAVGGVGLFVADLPVARGAWQAQRADAAAKTLVPGKQADMVAVMAGAAALDRAVAADPVAHRYLQRSEFLAAAALGSNLKITPAQQRAWLLRARTDLVLGLANAPSRGAEWLRFAIVSQALDGRSRDAARLTMMSIGIAPAQSWLWQTQLRAIMDNWGFFTDPERDFLRGQVIKMWRATRSDNRYAFGRAVREPVDEMILRTFLRDEPGAQQEISRWIKATR